MFLSRGMSGNGSDSRERKCRRSDSSEICKNAGVKKKYTRQSGVCLTFCCLAMRSERARSQPSCYRVNHCMKRQLASIRMVAGKGCLSVHTLPASPLPRSHHLESIRKAIWLLWALGCGWGKEERTEGICEKIFRNPYSGGRTKL